MIKCVAFVVLTVVEGFGRYQQLGYEMEDETTTITRFLGVSVAASFNPGEAFIEWEAATVDGDASDVTYALFMAESPSNFSGTLGDLRAASDIEVTTQELSATVSDGLVNGTTYDVIVVAYTDTSESTNRDAVELRISSRPAVLAANVSWS